MVPRFITLSDTYFSAISVVRHLDINTFVINYVIALHYTILLIIYCYDVIFNFFQFPFSYV